MDAADMTVGQRVRLVNDVDDFSIPASATGTVVSLFPGANAEVGEPFAHVRFDDRFEELDAWDNVLHVFDGDGDVSPDDFEPA